MEVEMKNSILAAVTLHPEKVSGGAPTFHVQTNEEQVKVATYIAKATLGMVHDLENGTFIIVKH